MKGWWRLFSFYRLPKFRKRLRPLFPCYNTNADLETQNTVPLTRHLTRLNLDPLVRHESLRFISNGKRKSKGKVSPDTSPNLCINPLNGVVPSEKDVLKNHIVVVRRKFTKSICHSSPHERRFSLWKNKHWMFSFLNWTLRCHETRWPSENVYCILNSLECILLYHFTQEYRIEWKGEYLPRMWMLFDFL